MNTTKKILLGITVVSLLVNSILGLSFLFNKKDEHGSRPNSSEEYSLLSKRIFVENPNDIILNFIPLRTAVQRYLDQTGLVHSFFFEYLPSGTSIRSDEDTQLAGASLLKLPTIISLYKATETKNISLDQEVVIKQDWIDNSFGNLWRKGVGTKITLREASRLALVESDNTAIKIIRGTLGTIITDNETVLAELDVNFPYTIDGQSRVSARDYAAVLRCLYLSCYLKPDNSQEILERLTESPSFGRIGSGIPDNVPVAHKIGVFGSEVQSDCGIVYVPNRPYLLCIIIKAPSSEADQHMAKISELIFSYMNDRD